MVERHYGHAGAYAVLRRDGDLVVYASDGSTTLWSTVTDGHIGAYLALQADDNLVLLRQASAVPRTPCGPATPGVPPGMHPHPRCPARPLAGQDNGTGRVAAALEVVSFGESPVADEGCGYADEGEEVLGFALVSAVQASAAGQPDTDLSTTHR